jgi:hypothetical protein
MQGEIQMTMNMEDIKKKKDRLETNIKELIYRFEKTTSFIVTDVQVNRHFIENANLKRNVLYDVKTSITL